ncbi:hypothetical protein BJX65DRAFT_260454 [Aspergillus insuetus]
MLLCNYQSILSVGAQCYRQNARQSVFLRICKRTMATRTEPSKMKYKYVEDVERLDFYVPGGYHPVMLGDEFCSG